MAGGLQDKNKTLQGWSGPKNKMLQGGRRENKNMGGGRRNFPFCTPPPPELKWNSPNIITTQMAYMEHSMQNIELDYP